MTSAPSLVADIGGTNTRVALAKGGMVDRQSIRRFRNADHGGLDAILAASLRDFGLQRGDLAGLCVAVAGPVRDGVARMTNLDWQIDQAILTQISGTPHVAVLNDLQAQGHAIGHIAQDDLRAVLTPPDCGDAGDLATKLVIGLGTGFNAAPVHDHARGRLVPASESGHITLPTPDAAHEALAHYLRAQHGFAAVEEVLSGRGITHVHHHLHGDHLSAAQLMEDLSRDCPKAQASAKMVVGVLGTVVGDLALVNLPFGGIYLVGGVARALAPYLAPMGFAESFRAKGRFAPFMDQFPIWIVCDDYAALTGCAHYLDMV